MTVGLARRGGDDDLRHAGHLRGDGGHEQGRRQRGRSTGDIDAGAGHGREALAQRAAHGLRGPVRDRLPRMELAHPFRGQFHSRDKIIRGAGQGGPHLRGIDA